jgi:hypothetical protein
MKRCKVSYVLRFSRPNGWRKEYTFEPDSDLVYFAEVNPSGGVEVADHTNFDAFVEALHRARSTPSGRQE